MNTNLISGLAHVLRGLMEENGIYSITISSAGISAGCLDASALDKMGAEAIDTKVDDFGYRKKHILSSAGVEFYSFSE